MPLRLLYLMSLFLSNLRVGLLHFPVIILFHFLVCLPWWFTFCSFWYFFFLYARLFMFRIWSIYTFPYAVLYQSLFKYIHTIHASIHIYIHSRVHLCVCMWVYQQFAGLIISRLLSFPSFFFFFSLFEHGLDALARLALEPCAGRPCLSVQPQPHLAKSQIQKGSYYDKQL